MNSTPRADGLERLGFVAAAAGTAAMALAPFVGQGEPVMANYIPVLDDRSSSAASPSSRWALRRRRAADGVARRAAPAEPRRARRTALRAQRGAVATAVALLAFAWSYAAVPPALDGKAYYEILFWGGGHALQFTWTLLMLVAWLWLGERLRRAGAAQPARDAADVRLALAAVFVTPVAYLAHDIASVEHRRLLTWAMRFGGGVAILPVGLAVLSAWRARRQCRDARPAGRAAARRAARVGAAVRRGRR